MSTKEIKKTAYRKLGGSFSADGFVYLAFCLRVAFTIMSVVSLLLNYFNQQVALTQTKAFLYILWAIGLIINLQIPYAPFLFSLDRKTLNMSNSDREYDFNDMLYYYKSNLKGIICLHLLRFLYLALWFLTIVGVFIKFFAYSMAGFIKAEHPDWSANECISESRRIMVDNKFNLFYLYLTFIGWVLLSILTLGAIYPFVRAYIHMSKVEFYNSIKNKYPEDSEAIYTDDSQDNINDYVEKPLKNRRTLFLITIILSILTNVVLNCVDVKMQKDYYKKFIDINVIERDNIIDKLFIIEIEKDGKTNRRFTFRLY